MTLTDEDAGHTEHDAMHNVGCARAFAPNSRRVAHFVRLTVSEKRQEGTMFGRAFEVPICSKTSFCCLYLE